MAIPILGSVGSKDARVLALARRLDGTKNPPLPVVSVVPHVLLKDTNHTESLLECPSLLYKIALTTIVGVIVYDPKVLRSVELKEHPESV